MTELAGQVIALTGALADAGEHGVAAVLQRNVVNQFHDNDRLANPGTTEEPDLTALGVRGQQVDNLKVTSLTAVTKAQFDQNTFWFIV